MEAIRGERGTEGGRESLVGGSAPRATALDYSRELSEGEVGAAPPPPGSPLLGLVLCAA